MKLLENLNNRKEEQVMQRFRAVFNKLELLSNTACLSKKKKNISGIRNENAIVNIKTVTWNNKTNEVPWLPFQQ